MLQKSRFQTMLWHLWTRNRVRILIVVLCMAVLGSIIAACGPPAATAKPTKATPTATRVATKPAATATPTFALLPTPTRMPTPRPTSPPVQAAPTSAPVQLAPPILDLQPASMSIVGHLDCQRKGTFVCFARVLSRQSNQGNLNWTSFTNVPGHIVFSPASGTLSPGQSTLVTISVPFNACTHGLFFFKGPANTHTITWAC